MQYTSNYNLMLPEGTDTVNLLTQMNPNTSDIDAALFANKQAVVGRATELTAGTVHAITRSNADSPVFAFTATSNWTAGDTMSVDGTACTVYLADGTTPATGAYIINSEVLAIINGTRITLIGGGAAVSAASDVTYDNTVSGLTAADVQDAIDELQSEIAGIGNDWALVDEVQDTKASSGQGATSTTVSVPIGAKELLFQIIDNGNSVRATMIITASDAKCDIPYTRISGTSITDFVNGSYIKASGTLAINWISGTVLSGTILRLYAR